MKLRNKKTGEIGEPRVAYQEIYVDTTEHMTYCYKSITEFNEEWEDYTPAEPLIKDPKIREAVRAWAETGGIKEVAVMCHLFWGITNMTEIAKSDDACLRIVFSGDLGIKMGKYTITELCGEKEE